MQIIIRKIIDLENHEFVTWQCSMDSAYFTPGSHSWILQAVDRIISFFQNKYGSNKTGDLFTCMVTTHLGYKYLLIAI
jgi:hypothetical protein